jgi:hypothetical protein
MAADEVGPMERAWIVAGFRSMDSADWTDPEVFAHPDEKPVLMVPEQWIREGRRDLAFAAGMAKVFYRRYGWLALVRVLVHLDDAAHFFASRERESAD